MKFLMQNPASCSLVNTNVLTSGDAKKIYMYSNNTDANRSSLNFTDPISESDVFIGEGAKWCYVNNVLKSNSSN